MSGWTIITVEPEESSEEQIAPYKNRAHIERLASELLGHEEPAVGPEDCGLSVEDVSDTLEEIIHEAEKALEETGEANAEERVRNWLKAWSQDFYEKRADSLIGTGTPKVQYPSRGKAIPLVAEEILANCPYANRVLVVCANDTSDSGTGWLYEMEDGEFVEVDKKEGYGGARAKDVTGYFREEHNIEGRANPY